MLLESPGCWRKVTADSQRARWCWSRGCSGKEHCGHWLGLCIPARIHSLLGDTLQVQSRSKGSVERTLNQCSDLLSQQIQSQRELCVRLTQVMIEKKEKAMTPRAASATTSSFVVLDHRLVRTQKQMNHRNVHTAVRCSPERNMFHVLTLSLTS